jgi:serine/threonine-protein kinase haspin
MKAVRSIEMRGMISTSSSEAMSSSSGGVIEFRKEGGNAMVCESQASRSALSIGDKITCTDHVMRRVVACLVKVGQSRLLSGYMLLPTQCLAVLLFSLVISPMLSTRTKQVFSYGRRNRRIINDNHDLFDVQDTNKSSAPNGTGKIDDPLAVLATPQARRKQGTGKRREIIISPSSTGPPPMPLRNCPKKRRENDQANASKRRHSPSSARPPLSSHSVNVSRRSSLSGPKKLAKLSGSRGALVPKSPDINMDIIIIDDAGRRVSQERRVSKTNVQVNQRTTLHPGPTTRRHATAANAIVVSDSDDSDDSMLGIKRRAKWWPKVSSSSDEEDCVKSPIRSTSSVTSSGSDANRNELTEIAVATDLLKPLSPRHSSRLSPTKFPKAHFCVEIVKPRPPTLLRGQHQELTLYDSPPQPLRSKPRQLTPIRRKGSAFPQLPPSPSSITDSDISIDLANFTLSSTPINNDALPNQPPHLIPLLDECGQEAPVEFSAFIEAFPVHPIVRSSCSGHATFQKIGEASYSEVFGIGDVVLKIIPIRNEEGPDEIDAETPAPSDAKDVLKEVVVTRAMGEMCNGFVNLLKAYVIRGKYPSLLLDLWDEYNQTKGSESVRPGATPHVPILHLSLNLTRLVGRVAGVRYNRVTQWWPGFGSILVQPTCQDGLETGL